MIINISDLQFRWQKDTPLVLSIAFLQVAAGERLFIQGPSGSGKSTLLSLLAGVVTTQHGSIQVLDQTLENLSSVQRDHFRANHIGYIFQMFNLIPYLSVVDNVLLPCRFSKQRHRKTKARNGSLETEAKRLLSHLDMSDPELLKRPVTTLSVGQQQRVAAARALIGSPAIVIADEPTSSLDANRRKAFIRLLFNECQEVGATLLFVSHDITLASLFERTINLDHATQMEL
ncbi:methionine ABC transporter ATP-binding protein [Achromatium sp. WMS3]|nr:methionine ABC transporter ATP-binding protein [Achromatium sp. WMS3]